MSEHHEFPRPDEQTQTIENRRAMLRQAIKKYPHETKFQDALVRSLQAAYIRRAAKNGVFICYAQADDVFAFSLVMELRELGIRAFMDELDIPDDAEWGDAVGKAMRDCGVLLLILSPDALHDAEVQGERIYFLRTGKIIVPIVARACTTHGLEMIVEPINFEEDAESA
jgi:TIR domain-containing protein